MNRDFKRESDASMPMEPDSYESQRQRKARPAVLTALIIAFLSSMLGIVFAVIPGTISGIEVWIISLSVAVTGGLSILVVVRPAMTTGPITGVLSVYLVFHLNAGAIVAYETSGDLLRIIPYVIWFFPLVLFHRFTNFNFFRRLIIVLVGLGPLPIIIYVGVQLSKAFVVEQFDAIMTFLVSFYIFVIFVGFYSRHRDVEVQHAARAEQAERAAEVLRISDERFRLLGRATHDLIWDIDIKLRKIWWNDALLTVYGYDSANFCSDLGAWGRWVHPDDRDRVDERLRAVLDGHSENWFCEYKFICADGRALEVIDRGLILREEDGTPVRMIGSTTDMTDTRELERKLRQAQKMETVGQMTGGVAHDFNNLLTVILGNVEILKDELGELPHLQKLAKMSLGAAERGAELTHRLLAFSRKQALEPKVLDVAQLIQGMDDLLRRTLPENIDIDIVRPEDLWAIEADASQLELALLNLAVNARDSMPDGGSLTIEIVNALLENDYVVVEPDVRLGQYVMIVVTDTGEGIPPEMTSRVFEPFFTTKEVGKGSGLGLSMVFGFVKQSGGHIRIYSELGEGTAIRMYFPRALLTPENGCVSKVVEILQRRAPSGLICA